MSEEDRADSEGSRGFLGRKHHKVRFTELNEIFFARLILAKCLDVTSTTTSRVSLSLCDLFRRYSAEELEKALENRTFSEAPKISEILGDAISAIFGIDIEAKGDTRPALDYFHAHILTRLRWLESGDPGDNRLPCIDGVTSRASGKLTIFDIEVRPSLLRERLGEQILAHFYFAGKMMQQLSSAQHRPAETGPRIDFSKEVELLTQHLEERQGLTGETEFAILSNKIPFRWALQHLSDTSFTMPGIGTCTAEDKVLLPMFLEVNGFLDIVDIDLESDPLVPADVVVRYSVRRPATRNIFGASDAGLTPPTRSQLNETELTLYYRLHKKVREGLVFGGKPRLETTFAMLCAWLIRRATYCLEEPTYLGQPARHWVKQHEADKTLQMEDHFFLPHLYERLRNDFGSRVVKKPERFGGEIDILFDDTIPIELKVRRNRKAPLDVSDVDEKFAPSGQAAVYAAVSRLGFVLVLDLPGDDTEIVNLENLATVVERRFPKMAEFPTCIVVIVFRCYNRKPSSSP